MEKLYFVYILANKKNGTIYVGVTNNLERRVTEHKEKLNKGFSSKYYVDKLVWFEECSDINSAIEREKQLKAWRREWKLNLIESTNPSWSDLYYTICSGC